MSYVVKKTQTKKIVAMISQRRLAYASHMDVGHCKRYRATGPHRATRPESTWT